jgi:capsular polysaccharide biosynthesis protein
MRDRVPNDVLRGPKLYLTRQNATHRRVYNEAELADLLIRRGFEIIDSGDYTVTQQINLFRNARVVVAPHGAAITNIGFCNPGATIYELMPDAYINSCFNRLAQMTDMNYAADVCQADRHGEPTARSFTVDLEVVSGRLDALGF